VLIYSSFKSKSIACRWSAHVSLYPDLCIDGVGYESVCELWECSCGNSSDPCVHLEYVVWKLCEPYGNNALCRVRAVRTLMRDARTCV
jgi:hypothetical protein